MNDHVLSKFSTLNDAQKEIFDLSANWAKAMISNDAEQISSFMDDDWLMVSKFGVSTKSDFIAFVQSGDLTHSTFDLKELAEIRIDGDSAVLIGRVTNTANYRGTEFLADEWTTDVFKKTEDGWRCVLTHITDAVDRSQNK